MVSSKNGAGLKKKEDCKLVKLWNGSKSMATICLADANHGRCRCLTMVSRTVSVFGQELEGDRGHRAQRLKLVPLNMKIVELGFNFEGGTT